MDEFFVDGGLLQPENHEAIRQMCETTADRLLFIRSRARIGHDDALDYIVAVLRAISSGMPPNEAFGWSQSTRGRQKGNFALRNWDIQCTVQELLVKGLSKEEACFAVSKESSDGDFLLGYDSIWKICRGVSKDEEVPDLCGLDIYPVDPVPYRREGHPSPHFSSLEEYVGKGKQRE